MDEAEEDGCSDCVVIAFPEVEKARAWVQQWAADQLAEPSWLPQFIQSSVLPITRTLLYAYVFDEERSERAQKVKQRKDLKREREPEIGRAHV